MTLTSSFERCISRIVGYLLALSELELSFLQDDEAGKGLTIGNHIGSTLDSLTEKSFAFSFCFLVTFGMAGCWYGMVGCMGGDGMC